MREVIEMAQILLDMSTDTYMKSKYMLLAESRDHPGGVDISLRYYLTV